MGDLAFRCGNWIEGEGLDQAIARGPRPIPTVLALARDLLSALEHAHLHGIIVRRIAPSSVIVSAGGRGTITDLRFCSYVLPAIPPDTEVTGKEFMAPEVRDGATGDPAERRLYRGRPALLRGHRPAPAARPSGPSPADRSPTHLPAGDRADRPPGDAAGAGRPLPDRGRDAGGPGLRRGHVRDPRGHHRRGGDHHRRGPGPMGEAAPAGAGRRLRAAGHAGQRRVRPGLPGARPPPGARGGAQGAAPVAHAGP